MTSWVSRRQFQVKKVFIWLGALVLRSIGSLFKVDPVSYLYLQRAMQMGNPTETLWPSETMPMISRLLSSGFWNYSFFQFHRNYYFPYWAHKQYNPSGKSFIPRSHNILSINQTHRNWLSISFPAKSLEACLDMAGAVMPTPGSYTIEFAILQKGKILRPHDEPDKLGIELINPSECRLNWRGVKISVEAGINGVHVNASGKSGLIVSIRPFNMEGPALIHKLSFKHHSGALKIRGDVRGRFRVEPQHCFVSTLEQGDALKHLEKYIFEKSQLHQPLETPASLRDMFGMLTASFYFDSANEVDLWVEDPEKSVLPEKIFKRDFKDNYQASQIWDQWFPDLLELDLPGSNSAWFNSSRDYTLALWDYDSVTPGSFTYHHFWIRDAVVMMNAYMITGAYRAVQPIFEKLKKMVARDGLFLSQAGEFDGNGQALWILGQSYLLTGDPQVLKEHRKNIALMLMWISKTIEKHGGVLPPGFSAEHLGVADWYLWDNFWSLGGVLHFASDFDERLGVISSEIYQRLSDSLNSYLEGYQYYPAALGRKRDAGMIGSVAGVYPLKIPEFMNEKMLRTLDIIYESYFFKGGFFQENIHSGINPYLTMQVAEGFLILGKDEIAHNIMKKIKKWTQKCYTFPEAVHPKTKGGCMGDGFHGWAYAEVVTFFRHCFLLELNRQLVFLHGVTEGWITKSVAAKNLYCSAGQLVVKVSKSRISISGLNSNKPGYIFISLPVEFGLSAEKASYLDIGISVPVKRNLYRVRLDNKNTVELPIISYEKSFA